MFHSDAVVGASEVVQNPSREAPGCHRGYPIGITSFSWARLRAIVAERCTDVNRNLKKGGTWSSIKRISGAGEVVEKPFHDAQSPVS